MKNLSFIILLLGFFFIGCVKSEEPQCKQMTQTIESNQKEANYRCQGLANNYPNGYIVISRTSHYVCEPYPVNKSTSYQACSGISYTIKETWK